MWKYFLLIVLFSFFFTGCKKEQNRNLLNAYFKFKVDGSDVTIKDEIGINENTFECIIRNDTALYVNVDKVIQAAGFLVKNSPLSDTTYTLDSLKKGYYVDPDDHRKYYTTNQSTGTLTIKRGTFQAKDLLNTLTGTFAYIAEDTATHITHNITEGSFLMELKRE